jgi:hypothetical protein
MGEMISILGAMSAAAVEKVTALEDEVLKHPQIDLVTEHAFHAGMYARTIMLPKGVILTGALIRIPTILVFNGDAVVYRDDGAVRITGHNVMLGSAGRKQAFLAVENTHLTMLFPTNATTVEEAEAEFTDDTEMLMSRKDASLNRIVEA